MAETGIKAITESDLTVKQEQFCLAYVANNGNATAAARDAGYDCTSDESFRVMGFENLTKPNVIKRIKAIRGELNLSGIVSVEYVVAGLKEVSERCMQKVPILNSQGLPTGEYKFDSSGANRAYELLGKTVEAFTDVSKSKNLNANVDFESFEEAQEYLTELGLLPEPENGDSDTVNNDFTP